MIFGRFSHALKITRSDRKMITNDCDESIMMDRMQLMAYLERIGFRLSNETEPSVNLLNALMLAHVTAVPFENLSVLLAEPVLLTMEALMDKLVYKRRGGCCFEQNLLFAAALRAVGFRVHLRQALMRLHLDARSERSDRSHLMLVAECDNAQWLVDIALGSLSLTSAVALDSGDEQVTRDGPRRITRIAP